jgi:hypothetical protein
MDVMRYAAAACQTALPNPLSRREVVYLCAADKYHRLTRRLSQDQKGLEERAIMAS